jgi:hypothetical protein
MRTLRKSVIINGRRDADGSADGME